jgi:transposase
MVKKKKNEDDGKRRLAFKFRGLFTPTQELLIEKFVMARRYGFNFALARYEQALDLNRAEMARLQAERVAQGEPEPEPGPESEETQRKAPAGFSVFELLMEQVTGERDTLKSQGGVLGRLLNEYRDDLDSSAPAWLHNSASHLPNNKKEVHSHVYGGGVASLDAAVKRYWKAKGRRKPWTTSSERKALKEQNLRPNRPKKSSVILVGPPRFKRRGDNDGFSIQALGRLDQFIAAGKIKIPGGVGWVRTAGVKDCPLLRIHPQAVPCSISVRKIADYWEIAFTVAEPWVVAKAKNGPSCGIDLGINAVVTLAWSDGRIEQIEPPRPMQKLGIQLGNLQRKFSLRTDKLKCMACQEMQELPKERKNRKRICECGGRLRVWRSNRAIKLQMRIAKLHDHISRVRRNHLHELSYKICDEAKNICVEGHDITGLVSIGVAKNLIGLRKRDRRKAMLDIGWGELRRQLEYKAGWYGKEYLKLDDSIATDKMCHVCGTENKMPPKTSKYVCSGCDLRTTRQENTAKLCLQHGQPQR